MKQLTLAALISLTPGLALAAPTLLPTRDVSASYSLTAPGQPPQTLQLAYNAAKELARISSSNGYYVLTSLPAGQAQLVVPALRAVVQVPDFAALATKLFNAESNARFTPLGKGHYAGLTCEMYLVTEPDSTARTCLTPDGVMLHFSGHDANGAADLTALSVSYAPQPASMFDLPPGLTPLSLPSDALKSLLTPNGG